MEVEKYNENIFESIKKVDDFDNEYWSARELQKILEYSLWQKFQNVINKAIVSCFNSNFQVNDHFIHADKIVKTGLSEKKIIDFRLSRYACYLIVQNADPRKKVISLGQTYFAIQTRKQELSDAEYNLLSEDEKRLYRRNLTKKGNYSLNRAARDAGVKNFDKFHNFGYKGLYDGETADDIAKRKKIRYRQDILGSMGSEELTANHFRISQTEAKLKRDKIKTEDKANATHFEVGKKVRKTIKKLGGTMPEDLPTPTKSIKQLEKEGKEETKWK